MVPNETEQAVIGEILAMRNRGMSYPKIAQALTDRGIPTKQGNARWRHQTVRSIVKRQNGRVEYAG